ncbi:MAG TPA: A24 family peptidase [Mycobacterium sp.]|nr:A24 family peptidase [Mycobacterium sp.]
MGVGLAAVAAVWLAALGIYDIRQRRLPNRLTLPGAAAVLLVAAVSGRGWPALAGALALFGLYLAVHLVSPTAMGAGDVKLALGVGALTGAFGVDVWVLAALGAPALTALWATATVLRRAEPVVPHGPSMCLSAATAPGF